MSVQRYNITTVRKYEDKNGEDKKMYPLVGKLIKFPATQEKEESFIIELNMFPNTKFCVFLEDKDKNKGQATRTAISSDEPKDDGEVDEINLDDIPF